MGTLEGKVALVTGAGRGIGRASAELLARRGAAVVIVSRSGNELSETLRSIAEAGGKGVAVTGDLGNGGTIGQVVETTVGRFGRIDILMNNAAVIGPLKPMHEIEAAEWDFTMAVNLRAPALLTQQVAPVMIRQGSGSIINVTSGLGSFVLSPFGAYCVSKAGLNHLTRICAQELKPYGIRVNALDPGVVDSRMQEEIRQAGTEKLGEEVYRHFRSYKEKGMLASAETAAKLAAFLASEDSRSITGEIGNENHFAALGYEI